MEKLIALLRIKMFVPTPFSWFHILFILLTGLVTIVLVKKEKYCTDKKLRVIIGCFYGLIVLLEIIKQLIYGYNLDTHTFEISWVNFPFQFCSSPYYIYPLLIFLPETKVRRTLITFCATFMFFAGFGYFFFPVSFCEYLFINIQTMVHHGVMITIGILLMSHEQEKITYKEVLKGLYVLILIVLTAITINEVVNIVLPGTYINMCELNPQIKTSAPVFSDIVNIFGYPIFVLVYVVGFLGFATIVYVAQKALIKLGEKIEEKKLLKQHN